MPNFSEMSDIAKICIILAAVLIIALIVLICVTINVLKKPNDEEYVEKRYGEKPETSDDEPSASEPSDSEERAKKSQEDVDALIRNLQETADSVPSVSEIASSSDNDDNDDDDDDLADETENSEEEDFVENGVEEGENGAEDEYVDSAFGSDSAFDEDSDDDMDVPSGKTTELDVSAVEKALQEAGGVSENDDEDEEISDSAFGPEILAREKEEKGFEKRFETTFDSAFVQVQNEVSETVEATEEDSDVEEEAEVTEETEESDAEEEAEVTEDMEESDAEEEAEATEETEESDVEEKDEEDSEEESEVERAETQELKSDEDESVEEPVKESTEKKGFFVRRKIEDEPITVNPVNSVNIGTVNSEGEVETKNESAGIGSASELKAFLKENPVPKKNKKKISKKEKVYEEKFGLEALVQGARYFWYNSQDIEDLNKKEDMYFHCHYFEDPKEIIGKLIVEMYDCGFVRTEEIQKIAFGVEFKSMNLQDILRSKENVSFDVDSVTKEPTEEDEKLIFEKWCGYVDKFMEIIVINAPDEVKEYVLTELYRYGHNDADVLIYSPE